MHICFCNDIREKNIDMAIARGVRSFDDLCAALGYAPDCGECLTYLEEYFHRAMDRRDPARLSLAAE